MRQDGGRGGIRTHGGLPHARFRVECLKPDSATLPIARYCRSYFGMRNASTDLKFAKPRYDRSVSATRWTRTLTDGGVETRIVSRFWLAAAELTSATSRLLRRRWLGKRTGAWALKNVTILVLPHLPTGLHIVCPKDSQRYYLLFTTIHNMFAPLFTSIRTLLKIQPLPHRHDSTKTRNSACLT